MGPKRLSLSNSMKILLLDADGVVLKKGEYFSEKYAREYNVPIDDVVAFFKGPFISCQKGEADLKEVILPYLDRWGWQESVDDFLNYWFASDVVLNKELEKTALEFKAKGVRIYLASNNEKYRAQAIKNVLIPLNYLDGFYFSSDMKVRKEDPSFFRYILNELAVDSSEVAFVDNDQKNVDSALSVGILASLYRPETLTDLLEKAKND